MTSDNRIQVLEDNTDLFSIVNKIIKSGRQEAFCICDVGDMVRKNLKWKKFFPKMPIFYEVNCNDSRIVLETQAALGTGFSCVSKEEIRRIISLGVSPDRIIYANPTKKISHLKYAAEIGIKLLTFDNEEEARKIKKYLPSAKLIVRIDASNALEDNIYNRKYGVQSNDEIKQVLNVSKSLALNVIGISFYLNSTENIQYSRAIKRAKEAFSIGSTLGYNFIILDIGGLDQGKKDLTLSQMSGTLNRLLETHFPDKNLKIIAEVGKYCVKSSFKIVSYIHSKRILNDNTRMYYLDVGVYNGLSPAIFGEAFVYNLLKDHPNSTLHPSILWGPTCDSTDKISKDTDYLPDMEIGEWIVFQDVGAYTFPVTYEFNGFPLPNIHSIIEKKEWVYLTKNADQSLPQTRFVIGNSEDNCLIGLNVPYSFKTQYY